MQVDAIHRPPGQVPSSHCDAGLAASTVVGEVRPANVLLKVIAERIRVAADHLRIPRDQLFAIFEPHSVFEAETAAPPGCDRGFLIVETHHVLEGMVGKGALKIVFPGDLLAENDCFKSAGHGIVEVLPPLGEKQWAEESQAEEVVRRTMREFMTGESLSMSLKCQATGAPFAGSEGLVLCAHRVFEPESGRYFLKPALKGREEHAVEDKELIEFMMNSTAEVLTFGGRIAYDKIVHAAETNSTLTARLSLQLPTNVVEGHLRALLQSDPEIIIGDEDMTPRLRELLTRDGYAPTRCDLARAAASMQMEHAILLPASRQKLRDLLAALPPKGAPSPAQYRAIIDLFFGSGEIQQQENRLFNHREPILHALGVALSAQALDECGDPEVLTLYLKTLLDNERVMLQAVLMGRLAPGASLTVDWYQRSSFLSAAHEEKLRALIPPGPITREEVARRFLAVVEVLFEALRKESRHATDPYEAARHDLLQIAIRTITSTGEVIPPVERILFFTLPFTYDCATPKLGVVTRKPKDICGSELRPQAMAVGAVFAIEILLKKFTRNAEPFAGLRVAIEGLGNAGKNVVLILKERGARITGLSDSKGALIHRDGFSADELASILAHKDAGKRLDTYNLPPVKGHRAGALHFHHDPAVLKNSAVDLLVLTAIPGSIDEQIATAIQAKMVCELTGAAVTVAGKKVLKERHIEVIPDNLASSGGMLVSLSEMLQNSAAQVWDRQIEEANLYQQISRSYDSVVKLAGHYNVDFPTAADMLALRRMQDLTLYHERLKHFAMELGERIRAVGPEEPGLVMLDDDEDGAAAAAILKGLFTIMNPSAIDHLTFLSTSFRSEEVLHYVRAESAGQRPARHVFVLDRSYPLAPFGQRLLTTVAAQARVTFINNHELPLDLVTMRNPIEVGRAESGLKTPADLGILLISPQTLHSTIPARHFPTSMILKDLARLLCPGSPLKAQTDWQAAVGSCLDIPELSTSPWLLFYAQFNPDKILEAARAVRTVTRAGGFLAAIDALTGVTRPDLLETNGAWELFFAAHKSLDERVQVLVEKIVLENRRRPATVHFFTPDEVAWPTGLAGNLHSELNLYHWISERITGYGDLAEKPIIVGQVLHASTEAYLGVRIRSPKGVDLMKAGLPSFFESGGLPNTAVAKLLLSNSSDPRKMFQQLSDEVISRACGAVSPPAAPPINL